MRTHAEYILWAGVTNEDISDIQHPFIKKIDKELWSVKKEGLTFQRIGMHGETVGIGVVIQEMSWTTEISESNHYDATVCKKASEAQKKINDIFKEMKLRLSAKIYHHVDLGG